MKVRDLVKLLRKQPQDLEVRLWDEKANDRVRIASVDIPVEGTETEHSTVDLVPMKVTQIRGGACTCEPIYNAHGVALAFAEDPSCPKHGEKETK